MSKKPKPKCKDCRDNCPLYKGCKERMNKQKGYTWIEVLVVIAILGTLAAVVLPYVFT